MYSRPLLCLLTLALVAPLGACKQGEDDLSALDAQLTNNQSNIADAASNALADQIVVDPRLVGDPRPAARPDGLLRAPAPAQVSGQDAMPVTLGQMARRQGGECAANLKYGNEWAGRMPAEFALYPGGKLTEAAGSADRGCGLRAISFTVAAPVTDVVDYYYSRATRAGYDAEHQKRGEDHVLGGTRKDDAYVVMLHPKGGGVLEVDVLANHGG